MIRSLLPVLSLMLAGTALHAGSAPQVVASIKPLHSLAANITRGVSQPQLLMHGEVDPHHFSLRPSQRRLIASADLVVWVGPQLEAALGKAIGNGARQQLALLDIDLPARLPARAEHDDHAHAAHHSSIDPHIWLSPDNAREIVRRIAAQLIKLDPANRNTYQRNLHDTLAAIEQLDRDIAKRLGSIDGNKAYIAWHDSWQYFEQHYGLTLAGAINASDSSRIGARQLSHLYALVNSGQVQCIVHDKPQRPALLRRFAASPGVHFEVMDVLGNTLPAGEQLWFDLMRNIAGGFARCLDANRQASTKPPSSVIMPADTTI